MTPTADYYKVRALSNSGMRDLAISALRYWHRHLNPEREIEEDADALIFGSALHCIVLEPKEFSNRYVAELEPPEDCLITDRDLRQFAKDNGIPIKARLKADVIDQVRSAAPNVPILDVMLAQFGRENEGKTVLTTEQMANLQGCVTALLDEPKIRELIQVGEAEVPLFATDPDTSVPLKAKLDWMTPRVTLDLKTFNVKRENTSVDKTVANAILYEGYYRQAYHYQKMRRLALGESHTDSCFVLAFVESKPPHETRIRALYPKTLGFSGNACLYWERARIESQTLTRLYADCMAEFGVEKPWRWAQPITALSDEEVPGLAW